MKATLLLKVKPGHRNIEMLTDNRGNSIPSKKIPIYFNKWERQGKPTFSTEIREKYRKGGICFSEQRKEEIKSIKAFKTFNVRYVEKAAWDGTYKKIINFLSQII